MAMFNFQLDGEKQTRKPMRSYIDIDESGRPTARIYADEYDDVKANPDFQPFISNAGKNITMAQDNDAYQMQEARIADVQNRINLKRKETIKAETEARKAQEENNIYSGPDFLGSLGGLRQTYAEKNTSRQQELKKLLEERSGYMETPEISASMQAETPVEQAPAEQTTSAQNEYINLKAPDGNISRIKKSAWSGQSKTKPGKKVSEVYLDSGYSIVP
jgi:hypothetical protein